MFDAHSPAHSARSSRSGGLWSRPDTNLATPFAELGASCGGHLHEGRQSGVYGRCSSPGLHVCLDDPRERFYVTGPMTKMVLPNGSITSNVRAPHGSFFGGRFTATLERQSS